MLALTHLSTRYCAREVPSEAARSSTETVVPRDFDAVELPFPEKGEPRLSPMGPRGATGSRSR